MNTFPRVFKARQTAGPDLLASLVVFLVALPLCMGIAIASGAPVAAGLVTGIIGGCVVGVLAGSPLQVSGPAAGLTVVCAEVVGGHGLAALGVVTALAGAIQLVAGLCKVGQWFRAVSPAVVHGMLAGIGVLILASQLHVMVDDRPRQGGLANLISIPAALEKGLPLPGWEPREARESRLAQLQTFGRLHERQAEIAAHVARLVSPGRPLPPAGEAAALASFEPLQERLAAELAAAEQALARSPLVASAGEEGAAIAESLQAATQSAAAALKDLGAGSLAAAAESQRAAADSLAAVLARLKSHDWAAKVGMLSIAVIVLWQAFAPRRLKILPGPLLAVGATTALAWALSLPVLYVEVPDRLLDGLTLPAWHVFNDMPAAELVRYSLFMAVIASAETLLCASAVDRLHSGPRTHYDRELAAQGVGNLLCGLCGGLPLTGVIVRSAANVQAGAKTRLAAILHGLWLLVFVVLCGAVLRLIPTAALAGILVYTGFRLIDFRGLARLWQHERSEALIFVATLVLIVVEDLLVGVLVGCALAAVKLLWTFSRLEVGVSPLAGDAAKGRVSVRLAGAATFLRLPVLAARLDEVPLEGEVRFDLDRLTHIDEACLDLLKTWQRQREASGQRIGLDRQRLEALREGSLRGATVTLRAARAEPAAAGGGVGRED